MSMPAPVAGVDNTLSTKIELSLSAADMPDRDKLSKSDGFIVLYLKEGGGNYAELGRTETVFDNHHPSFTQSFDLTFKFETTQKLKVALYDNDDKKSNDLSKHQFVGECELTVGELVNAQGMKISRPVVGKNGDAPRNKKSGVRTSVLIRAEERSSNNDVVHMELRAQNLPKMDLIGHADPYVQISRALEDGTYQPVFKSEIIKRQKAPRWKPVQLPIQKLCGGDIHRPLLWQVWDWDKSGRHDLCGEFEAPLAEFVNLNSVATFKNSETPLTRRKNRGTRKERKTYGTFFARVRIERNFSLLDFVQNGLNIGLCVAVDFTASNGAPNDPSSLHFFSPDGRNQYSDALHTIGNILAPYDSDGNIAAWGFGGRMAAGPQTGMVSHCFALNGNDSQPEVPGVPGLLQAYRNAFSFVRLSGPTNFAPVLHATNEIARTPYTPELQHYTILLILTDGIICDMEQTVRRIVSGSKLPMSIIIVGIGNADFSGMERLDADDAALADNRGNTALRDIVQFVPFSQMNCDPWELARVTLQEVPEQLTGYMKSKGIKPRGY